LLLLGFKPLVLRPPQGGDHQCQCRFVATPPRLGQSVLPLGARRPIGEFQTLRALIRQRLNSPTVTGRRAPSCGHLAPRCHRISLVRTPCPRKHHWCKVGPHQGVAFLVRAVALLCFPIVITTRMSCPPTAMNAQLKEQKKQTPRRYAKASPVQPQLRRRCALLAQFLWGALSLTLHFQQISLACLAQSRFRDHCHTGNPRR